MSPSQKTHGKPVMTPAQRRFVLQSIAAYRGDDWIVQELKRRWGIDRSVQYISCHYRYSGKYKEQIDKYREKFDAELESHPAYSKRHVLDVLYDTMLDCKKRGDAKGVAAMAKQIAVMVGHNAPSTVEHNHTVTGGLTYDKRIELINTTRQEVPETVIEAEAHEVLPDTLKQRLLPKPKE